jgi:hypothetical protein
MIVDTISPMPAISSQSIPVYISMIPREMLQVFWPHVEGHLQRALEQSQGEATLSQLKTSIEAQEFILLGIFIQGEVVAALTLHYLQFPNKKTCRISLLGGEKMDLWLSDLMAFLDNLAKQQLSSEIEFSGRQGWGKTLSGYGYKLSHSTFAKILV